MPRWDLAEKIQEWVHPVALNAEGRPARLIVPGHEGKQYVVTLGRSLKGQVTLQCCEARDNVPCKGNSHSLCYHGLAAILYAIRLSGHDPQVCEDEATARASGGQVVKLASAQGPGEAFLAVKPLSPKTG